MLSVVVPNFTVSEDQASAGQTTGDTSPQRSAWVSHGCPAPFAAGPHTSTQQRSTSVP